MIILSIPSSFSRPVGVPDVVLVVPSESEEIVSERGNCPASAVVVTVVVDTLTES